MARYYVGRLLRRKVGTPCAYCGVTMTRSGNVLASSITRDHAFPAHKGFKLSSLGGLNRVLCCNRCNNQKKGLDIVEWWHRLAKGADRRAPRVLAVIRRLRQEGALSYGVGEHWDALRDRLDDVKAPQRPLDDQVGVNA